MTGQFLAQMTRIGLLHLPQHLSFTAKQLIQIIQAVAVLTVVLNGIAKIGRAHV